MNLNKPRSVRMWSMYSTSSSLKAASAGVPGQREKRSGNGGLTSEEHGFLLFAVAEFLRVDILKRRRFHCVAR